MHDPHSMLYAASVLAYLYGQAEIVANRLHASDQPGAATAAEMAHGMLGEALTRLGVPLPGDTENVQDGPLVFGMKSRVGTDQGFDSGRVVPLSRVAGGSQ